MSRVYRALHIVIFRVGVLVFAILMLNILVSIAARYLDLPITNIDWVEETSRFLFIWLSFLGAALAVERSAHIRIDFFARLLPARARMVLEILVYLGMVVFAAVMTYEGALISMRAGDRSPVLLIPMSYAYLALPVGGAAIVLFALRILFGLVTRWAQGEGYVDASGQVEAE
ncbi:MAG TPA: TRAP transporter small permease [Candidatus Baltobacteraceae bacterium]|nr:TRAP transporter small permease [Candidatus Baltobacteraceae bacterium]HVP10071.1 TRAP transporter small permease [Phycisphaerae bacterium]